MEDAREPGFETNIRSISGAIFLWYYIDTKNNSLTNLGFLAEMFGFTYCIPSVPVVFSDFT